MILALDHWLFGNGYGMKSPFCDNRFYWLSGQLYTFGHGFGAQLKSIQWRMPIVGETRVLCGTTFRIFSAHRTGPRVMCNWGMINLPQDIDAANTMIREFRKRLDEL